eukprot:1195346-Prorocentrum_minimum.AAC.1
MSGIERLMLLSLLRRLFLQRGILPLCIDFRGLPPGAGGVRAAGHSFPPPQGPSGSRNPPQTPESAAGRGGPVTPPLKTPDPSPESIREAVSRSYEIYPPRPLYTSMIVRKREQGKRRTTVQLR